MKKDKDEECDAYFWAKTTDTAPSPGLVLQLEGVWACSPTIGATNSQTVSFEFQIQHFVRDVKVKKGHTDLLSTFNF